MRHPHADLIKAWADDTSRVVQCKIAEGWVNSENPLWDFDREYRFKPEPPKVEAIELKATWDMSTRDFETRIPEHWELPNLRLTFEDGKLIKAEVTK